MAAGPIAGPVAPVAGRVGILGGTFDPVHLGHLAVAEEAREVLGLETVLFIPAGDPPHKPAAAVSDARHRAAMVELAISPNTAFRRSRIEVERPGPSWTVLTLAALRDEAAAAGLPFEPWLILSVEAVLGLEGWREPDRVLAMCRLAVAPRAGTSANGRDWLAARFPEAAAGAVFLDRPHLGVSGTEIRARVAAGR
ncbi:MAG: nicotinate-nicotinamide nucleotide adenylyltransferase, partial [Chloroflexi bacterium]|nr:nicotinate-nicotinamide nucleotide adenylyltransferase [Chloroflexota bacterium]